MHEGPNKRVKPASSSDSNSDSDFSPTPKRNKLRQDGQTIKKMPMNGEEKFMFFAPFQNGTPAADAAKIPATVSAAAIEVGASPPVTHIKKFKIGDLYGPSTDDDGSAEEIFVETEEEESIFSPPPSPMRKQK